MSSSLSGGRLIFAGVALPPHRHIKLLKIRIGQPLAFYRSSGSRPIELRARIAPNEFASQGAPYIPTPGGGGFTARFDKF